MTPVLKSHGAMGFSLGSSLTSLGPGALQHSFASTRVLMPRWDGTTSNRTIRVNNRCWLGSWVGPKDLVLQGW